MRILQVHKYFTRKRGGGSVTVFFEMIKLLEKKGHAVSVFALADPQNEKTPFAKYFPSHFDLNEKTGFFRKLRLAVKLIYNREAEEKLEKLIREHPPEIAHLHNIYHYLTPSIIRPLKKRKIPVVMTLHDYKLICPNYKLFNKGQICEKCKGGKYYQCFFNKCLKNSWRASFLAMLEAYIHKLLKSYEGVNLFLAPSDFMREKCVEFGIPAEKIKKLRNIFDARKFEIDEENPMEENYFVFFGRISEEKGLTNLVQAVKKLVASGAMKENRLLIVGKGSQEAELKKLVKEKKLEDKIIFSGFKQGAELREIILKAKFVVVPSLWHDNSPSVIIEAQFYAKPVIVSDRGGSKESLLPGETGLVFQAEEVSDLAKKISQLLELTYEERLALGRKGRENIRKINDEEKLYQELLGIYRELLAR